MLAVIVASAVIILIGFLAWRSIDRHGIHGAHFASLTEQQTLIADILPPPLSLLEYRVLTGDLVSRSRREDRSALERRLHDWEQTYRARLQVWSAKLPTGQTRELLLERSAIPAGEYFGLVKEFVIPAVEDGNYDDADAMLQGPLRAIYDRHQSAIVELVSQMNALAEKSKGLAIREQQSQRWSLGSMIAIGCLLVLIPALYLEWKSRPSAVLIQSLTRGANVVDRADAIQALQQYHAALDAAAIVAFTDAAGRITHANNQFCEISGYSREELIGANHRIVNSGHHPRAFWIDMWRTISRGEIWHAEVCNRAKNGRLYWVDTTIVPMRDAHGRIHQHVAIRSDITLRKEMEATQRLQERKIRAVFDQSFQFIGLLDPTGRIVDANRTALEFAGVKPQDVVGKNFWDTPWWSHSAELQEQLKDAIRRVAKGESVRFEAAHPSRDGSMATVDFSMKPVFDEKGQVVWLIPEGRDITELRRGKEELRVAKEAAEAANHTKSEFLANMSHEIRTPMTAILGFAELLMNEAEIDSDPTLRMDAARTIHRNGEHLLGIINDILDLSKIESGKFTLEELPTSLLTVIEDVLALMRVRAAAKGIKLGVVFETDLPESISTDPLRLRQILVNLVGNAIKFTEVGGVQVVVRYLALAIPRLEIDVIDSGIGMSPTELQRLFQPFNQGDSSLTRKFGGTGLGLTISRRLAEMLQGELFVVETAPGQGTRFRLVLQFEPFLATGVVDAMSLSSTHIAAPKMPARPAESLVGKRILLAEDGPDNQRLLRFVLKKSGAEVTIAENGKLAIDEALRAETEQRPYDLILMDMQMPVMDGYEAVAVLRSHGYQRTIIALTAHAMTGDREKCLEAGCDDYLTKPIDREGLVAFVGRFPGRKAAAEEADSPSHTA